MKRQESLKQGKPPAPSRPAQAVGLGQRERNKQDKLRRIKDAARELFVSKGYDDTTTREIAVRAGVGMGTVFTYAENKRDLLFLVANDELEETLRCAAHAVRKDAPFGDNLLAMFRCHYAFFAVHPQLSRLVLREMVFYEGGQQASRFHLTRERVIILVTDIVRDAIAHKAIRSTEDSRFIGWVIFCIFQVEVRRWVSGEDLDVDAGMATLERALRLFVGGLSPRVQAFAGMAGGGGDYGGPDG
jgi:AcrR family transcriptional regulator